MSGKSKNEKLDLVNWLDRPKKKVKEATDALIGVLQKDLAKAPTEKLWSDQSFLSWLHSLGIEHPPGQIPQYKEGGVGRAYFVGDHVIKFTRDQAEANVAANVAGRKDTHTAVTAVKKISPGLWAIVMDRLDTEQVTKAIKNAADALMAYLDDHPEIKTIPQNPITQNKIAQAALKEAGFPLSLTPQILQVMAALGKLYHATGFLHNDAGPTNLALNKNGELAFPDLGPNMTKDFNPKSFLTQLDKTRQQMGLSKMTTV